MSATVHTLYPLPHHVDGLYQAFREQMGHVTAENKRTICNGSKAMVLGYDAVLDGFPMHDVSAALVALRAMIQRHYSDDAARAMLELCADVLRGASVEETGNADA